VIHVREPGENRDMIRHRQLIPQLIANVLFKADRAIIASFNFIRQLALVSFSNVDYERTNKLSRQSNVEMDLNLYVV